MRKKWWTLCWGIIGAGIILTGCNTTELEERCFPMMVSVGYEDGKVVYGVSFPQEDELGKSTTKTATMASFSESKISYEKRLSRDADYNHLKVLVLEDDFLEKKEIYEEMLEYLAQTEEFPRNTYVCAVDEVDDLHEIEETLPQDLGTYLEEYLKKQEEKKDRLLTLGDLMDEEENQTMVLYLPYLEVEENFVEWKGYMNTSGKGWKESKIE